MAKSLFVVRLEFLQIRGGCSFIVASFFLMLVGNILLYSVYLFLHSAPFLPTIPGISTWNTYTCFESPNSVTLPP